MYTGNSLQCGFGGPVTSPCYSECALYWNKASSHTIVRGKAD